MTVDKRTQGNHERFLTPLRLALTLLVFSLLAVAGVSSCTSSDEHPASANLPGIALPANVRSSTLKTADGGTISLADYSGKVVLVNLWATWCGPCRQETPELVKLHQEFQSQGVEMIGLSTENPDDSGEKVRNFVKAFQVDYHIGWASAEVLAALSQVEPQRDAIPQSYIISRDGRVLKKFIGFNPNSTPAQIKQALQQALKGA